MNYNKISPSFSKLPVSSVQTIKGPKLPSHLSSPSQRDVSPNPVVSCCTWSTNFLIRRSSSGSNMISSEVLFLVLLLSTFSLSPASSPPMGLFPSRQYNRLSVISDSFSSRISSMFGPKSSGWLLKDKSAGLSVNALRLRR